MEIVRIPRVVQDSLWKESMHGRTVGFVPTMGALHDGHLMLMKIARKEMDILVASIFVNPLQFGPKEDFDKYPRNFDADVEKLKASGVDILFLPDNTAMYPAGFATGVSVHGLSDKLCGAFRPGHFDGVATVVTKLLNIVRPKSAYFGQKDYQQCLVIKRLIKDLNMGIEVVICPTVRETGGLAMSSRNANLDPGQRASASILHKALSSALHTIKSGEKDALQIKKLMRDAIESEPSITEIQYASVYDMETLEELDSIGKKALLAVAVKMGEVRLIDNLIYE